MKVVPIQRPNSPTYKRLMSLTRSRGVKSHSLALVSGPRQTREIARDFPDQCEAVVFSEDHRPPFLGRQSPVRGYQLARELFRQIDLFDTGQPIVVVKVPRFPALKQRPWPPGCTLYIPFQDPVNVGSAIRAAAAFGVSRAVILNEAAHPFHPKAIRAAGANVFRVPIVQGPSIKELGSAPVPVITLSPGGKDVRTYRFPPRFCLVPGLEGPGIPAGTRGADALAIPMKNGVESLNAAMATGIVLYLWQANQGQGPKRLRKEKTEPRWEMIYHEKRKRDPCYRGGKG